MSLFLLSAIPLVILLFFGTTLKQDTRLILKVLCVPFVLLVAFYSFIAAALCLAGYLIYWKFIRPKVAPHKKEDWPKIRWE